MALTPHRPNAHQTTSMSSGPRRQAPTRPQTGRKRSTAQVAAAPDGTPLRRAAMPGAPQPRSANEGRRTMTTTATLDFNASADRLGHLGIEKQLAALPGVLSASASPVGLSISV